MTGLYDKYLVCHTDGGPLPKGFDSFLLRLDAGASHREASLAALKTYADRVSADCPQLAADLRDRYGLDVTPCCDERNQLKIELARTKERLARLQVKAMNLGVRCSKPAAHCQKA